MSQKENKTKHPKSVSSNKSIPHVQFPKPNKPRPLHELVPNPNRPSDSQRAAKVSHVVSSVEPPELPRTVLPGETLDDGVAAGVLVQEIRGVEDNVVDYDPDAVEVLLGFEHDCAGDEGEVNVCQVGVLERVGEERLRLRLGVGVRVDSL